LPQLSGTVDIVDNIFAKAKGSPVAIIMMGSPGSGKSTWVKRNCGAGFVVLSRDTGGAHWERKAAEALKLQNAHIVIDNTHPTSASRDESIVIAMRGGVKAENIHIVHITTPVHVCIHLNEARRATGAASVPTIAIHVYWKKMDKLAAAGIGGMVEVPFAMEANAPAEIARHVYRLKGR
jgi:predicted kinase